MKEVHTDRTLLKKDLADELYRLNTNKTVTGSALDCNTANLKSANNLLVCSKFELTLPTVSANIVVSKDIWHRRLGHPSIGIFHRFLKKCNLPVKSNTTFQFCEACKYGKSHAFPFPLFESRAKNLFDLIHTDVWGPAPLMSTDGYRYYVHFLDGFSSHTWIYPLKLKNDVLNAF